MSIKAVRAVSYSVMQDYLSGNSLNSIAVQAENFDRVFIISITDPDELTPVLIHTNNFHQMALQFDDIDDHTDPAIKMLKNNLVLFNKEMAQKICSFVKAAHEDPEPGLMEDLLVVNCHAGVCRSGAVSDFVRCVCRIDYDSWKRMNSQVLPNTLVKKLLWETWEDSGY